MAARSHFTIACTAAAATHACAAATSPAAIIETQSNAVADGSINTSGGNNVRSDWAGVPGYVADANEGSTVDWSQVHVAHDSANFFLRYVMNSSASGFLTDQARTTGFTGGGDQLPIGADFMIEGASLYAFGGGSNQTAFTWSFVQGLSYDDFPTNDQEMTVPRSSLGNTGAFDFVLFASGTPEDYYPSTGNAGVAGGAFSYQVPEPAALALAAVGGITMLRRRRRSLAPTM